MPAPSSGSWTGLLVCAERTIKVSITFNLSDHGTLTGEYLITDEKYAEADSAGKVTGTYADDLVTLQLDAGEAYQASLHGQVHPAPPNNQQVLSGYVLVFRGSTTEAGVLVLFSQSPDAQSMGGWDGNSA